MRALSLSPLLVWCALLAATPARAEAPGEVHVDVKVERGEVSVDAEWDVDAPLQLVWSVMTDFDHMAEFISNLQVSRVVSAPGEPLRIEQKGRAARGVLSFSFDSVRAVELTPHESIRTRLISGSLKKLEGSTRLEARGGVTHVVFHGESIPSVWVPPGIGPSFIRKETREQFDEMRAEILRRKRAHADAPAPSSAH